MSLSYDIIGAYHNGAPVLFWVNRTETFVVGNQQVAHNGYVASQRLAKNNLIGAPMIVNFILAKASHIKTWQGKIDDNPFSTTSLVSSFSTGHNVIFQYDDPLTYRNSVLRDGNWDLDQNIFNSSSSSYKRGFDVWEGTMKFFITS